MSDSDSSDDEGIPSLSALVQSLVPNASSDSDDDDENSGADTGGADTIGKLPSSISHLVQNLVKQYDSISDDDDSANSSSDDDDDKYFKKQATPVATTDDESDDDDDDNADLSNLVQNILKQRAHRDSVEINSRLVPIAKNIPKPPRVVTEKKVEEKKMMSSPKPVEPWTSHTLTSMASSMDGSHHLLPSSDDSGGLHNTMHSLPENEAFESPTLSHHKILSDPVVKRITPLSQQRRNEETDLTEHDTIHKTTHSLFLNESTHTVISAASTSSAFDPAELESALLENNKGQFNEDDDYSSSILNDSESSMGDGFASTSISTEHTSKQPQQRRKKKKVSSKRNSKSSKKSASSSSDKKKRKTTSGSTSSRRNFDKQPLSPLLGKMAVDDTPDEMDDILSPLPLQQQQQPLKQKKKKKKPATAAVTRTHSEQSNSTSGSRISKRSRSSLSRSSSSHKSPNQRKSKINKEEKVSPSRRSTSQRSKKKQNSIPETSAAAPKHDNRPPKTPRASVAPPHDAKPRTKRRSVDHELLIGRDSLMNPDLTVPETPARKSSIRSNNEKASKARKSTSQRSKKKTNSTPETPVAASKLDDNFLKTPRASVAQPPIAKTRAKRRSVDHEFLAGRDSLTNPARRHSIRSNNESMKDSPSSRLSSAKPKSKRQRSPRQSDSEVTPTREQSKAKDAEETPKRQQRREAKPAGSPDPPGVDKTLSATASQSEKISTKRADEDENMEYERPLHPVGPIHMISFRNHMGGLPLDDDTSISSSSTEEEDEYETESSEEGGDNNNDETEYGTDVSGSQIPPSHDSMPRESFALPSESGYETDPADAENVEDGAGDEYESDTKQAESNLDDYESDSSSSFVEEKEEPAERPIRERTGRRALLERSSRSSNLSMEDYESDDSDFFEEENEIEVPPKRAGQRDLLERSVSSHDLSAVLAEYDLDSDSESGNGEDPVEEPPKRNGRRDLLERSVTSQDLSAVLDEYDLDSDSESGNDEDPVEEPPKRNVRRDLLERSVTSQDLSAVLDEYDLDSDSESGNGEDPVEEPPKRNGRRDLLERSVTSQDLSAVLDEYDLDSDSESGNGEEYEASNHSGYESKTQQRGPKPKKKNASEIRPSWPAPGSNPRKNLPSNSVSSSSVDYTDSSDDNNENQHYEMGSDDEDSEGTTERNLIDESSFGSNNDFEFEDDYHVTVSSDESSDEGNEYSGRSRGSLKNEDDDLYYSKLDAVTRREDRLALRRQRLKAKICFAIATMVVIIVGLVVLFVLDPLQKDVGNRRLRGRIIIE